MGLSRAKQMLLREAASQRARVSMNRVEYIDPKNPEVSAWLGWMEIDFCTLHVIPATA